MTALTANNIVLVPIRSGLGLRLGANIGYLKYTPRATWEPILNRRLFRKNWMPVLRSEMCARRRGFQSRDWSGLRIHVNAARAGRFPRRVADVIHGKCDTKSFSRGVLIHD